MNTVEVMEKLHNNFILVDPQAAYIFIFCTALVITAAGVKIGMWIESKYKK